MAINHVLTENLHILRVYIFCGLGYVLDQYAIYFRLFPCAILQCGSISNVSHVPPLVHTKVGVRTCIAKTWNPIKFLVSYRVIENIPSSLLIL